MTLARVTRRLLGWAPYFLLLPCGAGLATGELMWLAGESAAGEDAWAAAGATGAAYSLYATLESFLRRRLGVDLIAFLALAGALAISERLAAG
jgi:hypothetical protein